MLSGAALVAGAVLVAIVLSDLFRTVLLPRPARRIGRIAPLVGAAVAPPWLRVARRLRSPQRRQSLRGSLGPMLLVLTFLIWVDLLFVGFGLMLFGLRDDFLPPIGFGDGVYFAASAFLTISTPDAVHGSARAVVIAAGLVGLAVITLLVTFILSVHSELTRREVLVLRTQVSAGEPPTGLALLDTYARPGMTDRLTALFRDWEAWAADVLHSHRANPILVNFHSADESGEWLAVLGSVMDAATLLIAAVENAALQPAVFSAARLFIAMGTRTVTELHTLLRLQPAVDLDGLDTIAREIRDVRQRLGMLGYRMVTDEADSIEGAIEILSEYKPQLRAVCRRLDITTARTLSEVNERRTTRLVPPPAGIGLC